MRLNGCSIMKIRVAGQYPNSAPTQYHCDDMELEHTENTGTFKRRWCDEKKIDPAAVTVYYNVNDKMQEREDEMPLSDGPFKANAPRGRTVLHVKVRDLDIEAEVRRRMSAGESMIIPLVLVGLENRVADNFDATFARRPFPLF